MIEKFISRWGAVPALMILFIACNQQQASVKKIAGEAVDYASARSIYLYHMDDSRPRGSGVIIDNRGHVLSASHIIKGWEKNICVSQNGYTFFSARVLKNEERFDLVLLETDIKLIIPSIQWIDREKLSINDTVFSICSPYGLNNSFLKGYISNLDRSNTDIRYPEIPFIQTQNISFPGCSGAGVYLYNGKLIGINRATFGYAAGNGTGLVIPWGFIKVFLKE